MSSHGVLKEQHFNLTAGMIRVLDAMARLNHLSREEIVVILLEQGLRQHGVRVAGGDPRKEEPRHAD